jgi:hypothetical protein
MAKELTKSSLLLSFYFLAKLDKTETNTLRGKQLHYCENGFAEQDCLTVAALATTGEPRQRSGLTLRFLVLSCSTSSKYPYCERVIGELVEIVNEYAEYCYSN